MMNDDDDDVCVLSTQDKMSVSQYVDDRYRILHLQLKNEYTGY